MTEEEFQQISAYMKQHYGIELKDKKEIVRGRMENFIQKGGWNSFKDFMKAVLNNQAGAQEKMLVNLLTTNYTFFMREFEHLECLRNVILPWIKKKESRSRDMRIWCGAASTGEEPYMLAMVITDFLGLERDRWDYRVLATDISTKALQKAIAGVYKAEGLKNVPEEWKKHFFKAMDGGMYYRVKDELKQQVIYRKFNLMDPFPFRKKMHVVFLRNVMIYFDRETKQELVRKVYDCLEPGGYLVIGLTESLEDHDTLFETVQSSVFRKKERKGLMYGAN